MAIISGSYLGNIRNKIGGAVVRNNRGQQVAQAYQASVSNPRTTGQVTQRNRFQEASRMAKAISGFLASYYSSSIQKQTPRNQWVSAMLKAVDSGDITPTTAAVAKVDYTKGVLSDGNLQVQSASWSSNTLEVTWSNSAGTYTGQDSGADQVYIAAINQTTGTYYVVNTNEVRDAGGGTYSLSPVSNVGVYTIVVFMYNIQMGTVSTSQNQIRFDDGAVHIMNTGTSGPWG